VRRAALPAALAALLALPGGGALSQGRESTAPRTSTAGTSAPKIDQAAALRVSQAAIGRQVGNYTLRTSDGRTRTLADLRGKPVLVSFIYTGCFRVCPTTTRMLKRAVESAQRTLGPDSFHVVSIGFNQPFDTPEAMGAFARQHGVFLPSWQFLSPDAQTLDGLARDLGFTWRDSAGGFDHITQVTVLDRDGRVYRQIYGDSFPLPQLIGPLKELLTGAPPADESVAGLLERVRILCTVYDPITGEYRYKTSIVFEIAGGLIGLSLVGVFMVRELRKARHGFKA
jgi:protein SCO1/2